MYNKIIDLPRLKDVVGMLCDSTDTEIKTIINENGAVFEKGSSVFIEVNDRDSLYFGNKINSLVTESFESITFTGAKKVVKLIEEELGLNISPYDIIYPLIEMNGDKF